MYNTLEEAQAAAATMDGNLIHLYATEIMVPAFNYEPKYKVSYLPIEYKEQYIAATYDVKLLFHYAINLTFSALLNAGTIDLFNNEAIKAAYDTEVINIASLKDLKTYLNL